MRLQSVCDKFVHTVLAVLPYRKGHGTFTKFVDVEERTIESQRQQLLTIKVSSNISRLRNEQQLGWWINGIITCVGQTLQSGRCMQGHADG